jgi:putative acetyltransferase
MLPALLGSCVLASLDPALATRTRGVLRQPLSLQAVITIEREPFESPAAVALREEQRMELIERYGFDSEPGTKPSSADVPVFLIARNETGDPVGCGGLRPIEPGLVEIKRMYVRPAHRGNGHGKLILAALEDEARALGAERVALETGVSQPESIGLYQQAGYREIPCFGAYAGEPLSRCFERLLPGSGHA